jgi:hypothetical protein
MLSKTGEIRRDEACLDYAGADVILYPCHGGKGNQVIIKRDCHYFPQSLKQFFNSISVLDISLRFEATPSQII